jgi:hypoxanthine-DNA glycosylase
MDTAITEVIPNPIPQLLLDNPTIQTILFNGQKAQKLFDKYFEQQQNITYHTLPSSSPANAQFSFDKLLAHWQIIKS